MYTTPDVKDCKVKSFAQSNGRLRVTVATVTFGMGIDCLQDYSLGAPSDVDSCIQETGRAGRDG